MQIDMNRYVLITTLLLAAYLDIKDRKIPNVLTFPVILWGLVSSTIISGFNGFQFSLFGFLFGMAAFFIPFALGLIGGGDVKLMGAVGAIMGWEFTLSALLYTAMAGGVVALLVLIWNKKFFKVILNCFCLAFNPLLGWFYKKTLNRSVLKVQTYTETVKAERKKMYIPYGVAIAIGTFLVLSGAVNRII
ncbi:A24 family peptidase [Anaerobium acetethylicum]|uniref:Prepilin peptidase CpaA n=1 Tax=Anaerobium acetethylicum TaxID=1619234 RepID=A0A1D3TV92_9FIRM|nr:A24 family peptidase [Anaerobium acetethylicum]SCP98029.1 prepilin peptidase CpaA [Anaerobium acetethylicum]